jgi:hypothetical protein
MADRSGADSPADADIQTLSRLLTTTLRQLRADNEDMRRRLDEQQRQLAPLPGGQPVRSPRSSQVFKFRSTTRPFAGILRSIFKADWNSNAVLISASSVYGDNDAAYGWKHVVDHGTKGFFSSKEERNAYIQFDFKDKRISPTFYTLQSRDLLEGHHMKSWVLQGSVDGESWVLLDEHEDSTDFHGKAFATVTYLVETTEEFRILRVAQMGVTTYGTHYLQMSAFEVFGTLNSY